MVRAMRMTTVVDIMTMFLNVHRAMNASLRVYPVSAISHLAISGA